MGFFRGGCGVTHIHPEWSGRGPIPPPYCGSSDPKSVSAWFYTVNSNSRYFTFCEECANSPEVGLSILAHLEQP